MASIPAAAPAPTSTPSAAPSTARTKVAKSASATNATQAPIAKPTKGTAKPVAKRVAVAKKAVLAKPANAPATVTAKDGKAKKPKLVRDSFTIPKDEYVVIEALKQRAAALAQPVKKSELLRAGLKVLSTLSDNALSRALQAVPSIKTGRPKSESADAARTSSPESSAKSTHR